MPERPAQRGTGSRRTRAAESSTPAKADRKPSALARTTTRPEADVVLRHLGKRIRSLREQVGLTQGELGELAGLHRVTVNRIEAGLHDVGASYLPKLAAALSVEVGDLYTDDNLPASR